MYSVPDMCVVNVGVLETTPVDAFDHCLGDVEPAAGNSYISEHGLKGCSSCLFVVCHGAGGRKVSVLSLLYSPPS